ncbi:MAG: cytidylate kinase family protein [Bryobacterales bacterium]|nr:cytidylate kinase family protein [Bryobacterales bacterium]
MGLITVSGEPGSHHEEVARLTAQRLQFELVNDSRLGAMIAEEFGADAAIPDRAWRHVAAHILARLATEHHLVVATAGAELLFRNFPNWLRVDVVAPEARRVGALMIDRGLDRAAARGSLGELEAARRQERKRRFGRVTAPATLFDITLNSEALDSEHMAALLEEAAKIRGILEQGLLSSATAAQIQFQIRLQLARHGIAPAGKASIKRNQFSHPSEEIFANLLDFYRIAWEYEPHSFPIQWDRDGKVLEAFTPDFYLPEFDMHVELTTMKQSLVTKKNHKVKLLKTIYPQVNIQVFYQKDFQNLIFKHGLGERAAQL